MELIQRGMLLTRTFGSYSKVTSILCHPKLNQVNVITVKLRDFHLSSSKDERTRPTPRLVYFQNPVTWLVNKLDFGVLKRTWDPQFCEDDFKRGTKQAVSTITTLISQNFYEGLQGLLTKNALSSLCREVETVWSDEQKRLISVRPNDIQLAVPRRVHFQSIVEQKFCDVDMVFIALKWTDFGKRSVLVFIEVAARFHRDYSEGHMPDWTVSLFHVTRFRILPK